MGESRLPEQPLLFIQQCVRLGKVFWSYHVNMRMRTRSIRREQVLQAVESFQLIESYPNDKYLPSCLVLAVPDDGRMIHLVFALDVVEGNVRVITAYYPDPVLWSDDMKVRIKQ